MVEKRPTLVFLHGWGMNRAVWNKVIIELEQEMPCLALDLPGYGDNSGFKFEDDYSLDWLSKVIEEQLPKQTILVGWSLGGLIAQHIAIHRPGKLRGLVCLATTPKFQADRDWPGIESNVLNFFHQQLSQDHQKTLKRFIAIQMQGIGNVGQKKQTAKELTQSLLANHPPSKVALDKGLDILESEDLRDDIQNIRMPTLRLYGRLDSLVPHQAIGLIEELDHSQHKVYPKAAHVPFITHLTEVNADILSFVKEVI